MFRKLACVSALVLAVFGAPMTAAAQTEKGNVAFSYGYLHDADLNLPAGWVAAVTRNVTPIFGVVGEVGGNYRTERIEGNDLTLRVHSFLGGVKVQGAASPGVVPFAQLLVGEALFNASALGQGQREHAFAVQPGGGVDIKFTPKVGLRVQGDVRMHRADGDRFNQFRFAVGGVFGFGR